MEFDYQTFTFLALSVNESYRKKLKKAKFFLKKFSTSQLKSLKPFLSRKFCQVTHLRDLKFFLASKVVKLRKGQKLKNFGNYFIYFILLYLQIFLEQLQILTKSC